MDQTTSPAPIKGSNSKTLLIGCLLLLCCCCVVVSASVGSIYYLFTVGSDSLNKASANIEKLCAAKDNSLNLQNAYDEVLSVGYKSRVSFTEFKSFVSQHSDIFADCSKLKAITFQDLLNGSTLNSSTKTVNGQQVGSVELTVPISGKNVTLVLITEGTQLKVDDIKVSNSAVTNSDYNFKL